MAASTSTCVTVSNVAVRLVCCVRYRFELDLDLGPVLPCSSQPPCRFVLSDVIAHGGGLSRAFSSPPFQPRQFYFPPTMTSIASVHLLTILLPRPVF